MIARSLESNYEHGNCSFPYLFIQIISFRDFLFISALSTLKNCQKIIITGPQEQNLAIKNQNHYQYLKDN